MPAYLLTAFDVVDPDGYAEYQTATVHTIADYDIKVLAMTDDFEVMEGEAPARKIGILQFKDKETLKKWYHSADYQAATPVRLASVKSDFLVALDGLESTPTPESIKRQ